VFIHHKDRARRERINSEKVSMTDRDKRIAKYQ